MATTSTRQQPPWAVPRGSTQHPKLKIYNSLTRSKVPFIPKSRDGRSITWYACGPTVYDDAHLGHARNYVTTDIIRRILRDYFKFDVNFIMNITDIDDKIILRGRQRYLYQEFTERNRYITEEVLKQVHLAYHTYLKKNLPLLDLVRAADPAQFHSAFQQAYEKKPPADGKSGEKEAKIKMHYVTAALAVKALIADLKLYTPDAFYELVQDVMLPWLDELHGMSIKGSDHAIFSKLTREYEERFFQDVRELNVLDPNEVVRVTEYGQEIAEFVHKIVQNRFGYATSDGSVYFDVNGFESAGNPYARLEPWNRGNEDLQAEGEGKLTQKTKEKRSQADFALWKASKAGEPSWSSPWGLGRPGWHIECSAMASAKLGRQMDIHSGGIDLAFPHHDNELAQSEAYWSDGSGNQWVNYFLHVGHLSIQGSKMSKSLKNFTTIRTALERGDWTPRSLRIIFLLGNWRDGIEITDDLVQAGQAWEDKVDNFFLNVKSSFEVSPTNHSVEDQYLAAELKAAKEAVYEALCDSFNTPAAMTILSSLISKYNSVDKAVIPRDVILATAKFITQTVNTFGLNGNEPFDSEELGWRGIEIPEAAKPFIYPLSSMRDELRVAARSRGGVSRQGVEEIVARYSVETMIAIGTAKPFAKVLNDFGRSVMAVTATGQDPGHATERDNPSKDILSLCDRVRDIDLWNLSIYLEDRENAPALVRPVTAALATARHEKEAKIKGKEVEKVLRRQEAKEKAERGRVSPLDMFKPPHTDEFDKWDDDGMPLRVKEGGAEVAKNRVKKLRKDWERQKKAHQVWLAGDKGAE